MSRTILVALLAVCAAGTAQAQAQAQAADSVRGDSVRTDSAGTAAARVGPPIRRISTASALSKEPIGAIVDVRELPDGRVLVNDGASRRLLLMDTTLAVQRVVLDSASEQENTYGNRRGALIAYRADSSLFVDPNSLALLVIDAAGSVTRVRSVPRAQDVGGFAGSGSSAQSTDALGRLVYRVRARAPRPMRPPPRGVPYIPDEPDSAFIVALDIETRKLDTLGAIRIPKSKYTVKLRPGGGWQFNMAINPLPSTDDWAVLPDGSVAFVRGIDYRVDYRHPDGSWTSSAKVPFDWQPMSDSAKQRLVDSVGATQMRNLRTQFVSSVIRWVNIYGRKYPADFTAPEGYRPPNGFARDWSFPPGISFPEGYIYGCAAGEEPRMIPASDSVPEADDDPRRARSRERPSCIPQPIPNTARVPDPPTLREVSVISPKELPDFRPPFAGDAVRADLDGNLWIRTNPPKPVPGGAVFDVVNRAGQLVDRLQLPPGYSLVGFGRGRVVFLSMRDAAGVHLARVRLR